MKKKILITLDSLKIGGAEKSLITLLSLLDYTKYDVDLQLISSSGEYMKYLPAEVNLLPERSIIKYLNASFCRQIRTPRKYYSKIKHALILRTRNYNNAEKAWLYWKSFRHYIKIFDKNYDVAIGYGQGVPSFYVLEKIRAKKKMLWVNGKYNFKSRFYNKIVNSYKEADVIVAVSDSVKEYLAENIFPGFNSKIKVMWDIINPSIIKEMAKAEPPISFGNSQTIIVTVARMVNVKGLDLAIKAAAILKEHNIVFKWVIIGDGEERPGIESEIKHNGLDNHVVLLGSLDNPYAYMSRCNIYVQTSRKEGFGLTIAEARILNRPVVCTNFEGCQMQLKHERNGLIASFNPEDIAAAIERLINDKSLYNNIQEYQRKEKIGNVEEIENFYRILEE